MKTERNAKKKPFHSTNQQSNEKSRVVYEERYEGSANNTENNEGTCLRDDESSQVSQDYESSSNEQIIESSHDMPLKMQAHQM